MSFDPSETAERYLASVERLTDRTPMPAMTRGFVRSAIEAAAREGYAQGLTAEHARLVAARGSADT